MAGSLCVFAEGPAGRAAKVMLTMDVLQRICLGIVITAVVLFLIFYIVKAVLKKLHAAPEENEEKTTDQAKEE
jgi:ammonia channel protein AmtB